MRRQASSPCAATKTRMWSLETSLHRAAVLAGAESADLAREVCDGGRCAGMPRERGVQLDREVGLRDHGVDAEHVRTRPGVGRLALDTNAIERQLHVDPRALGHDR